MKHGKRWRAILCAGCLLLTSLSCGIGAAADDDPAAMKAGDVSYMDAAKNNPYATAHGAAAKIVNIDDPKDANAWIRQSAVEYFGVTPSYGYAFDSQKADYLTDETGVYFRMQAGLTAEVALQFHNSYGLNCYEDLRLFWSTDPEAGDWTPLTGYTVSELELTGNANTRKAFYTVPLPSAATAGAATVYLDVRFPVENLASEGATSAYAKGGLHIAAVRASAPLTLPTMQAGDVSYMGADKSNPYATAHGAAGKIVNIGDPNDANAWIRDTAVEYFGVTPSYGYAFDSQNADYLTDETGVYFRMQAGLTADIALQYHNSYGKSCYSGMRLFWSTDPETGDWTPLTSYEVSAPEVLSNANWWKVTYTAPLPSAATAGAETVYLDVRFPVENLASEGATSAYAKGGLHIAAVHAKEGKGSEMQTMGDGATALLDFPANGSYSLAHGGAVMYRDLLTENQSVDPYWIRTPRIAWFGSGYAPSYGYCVNAQATGYAQQGNGVYYKLEAGLYATVALQYHTSFTSAVDRFTFYAAADLQGGEWTKLEAELVRDRTISSVTAAAFYTVRLPDAQTCGSDTVYLDVRFPTENLGDSPSVYAKGQLHIAAVRASAEKPGADLYTFRQTAVMTKGTLASFEEADDASGWTAEGAALTVADGALKAQAQAGPFSLSSGCGVQLPYGAGYTRLTARLRAAGLDGGLTLRLSDTAGTQWAEYDIPADALSAAEFADILIPYDVPDRTSGIVDFSALTRLTLSGTAATGGASVELAAIKRKDMITLAEEAIAGIGEITAENHAIKRTALEAARAACDTLVENGLCSEKMLYQEVPNYILLTRLEEAYARYAEAARANLRLQFTLSSTQAAPGGTVTAGVQATALNGSALPALRVEFGYSRFTVSPDGETSRTIAAGAAAGQASLKLKALEGGIAVVTADVYDAGGALLFSDSARLSVSGRGWYAADAHSHSTQSDGKSSMTENFLSAYNKGLAFLITADHNAVVADKSDMQRALANLRASGLTDFFALKMSELTGSYGHMLQYRTDAAHQPGTTVEGWQKEIDSIIAEGGLCYLAHPFSADFLYPGLQRDPANIDVYKNFTGLEIINSGGEYIDTLFRELPDTVTLGLEYLDRMNIKGEKKYYGIANSDAHLASGIATGRSVYLLDAVTEDNIYDALEGGRLYGTTGPQLRFRIEDAELGETLTARTGDKASVYVAAYDDASYITKVTLVSCAIDPDDNDAAYEAAQRTVLYSDDGTLAKSFVEFTREIDVIDGRFYRVEVESAKQDYARFAFSNPIWTAIDDSEDPDNPDNPDEPSVPDEPDEPGNPDEPDKPGTPGSNPDSSQTGGVSGSGDGPEVSVPETGEARGMAFPVACAASVLLLLAGGTAVRRRKRA